MKKKTPAAKKPPAARKPAARRPVAKPANDVAALEASIAARVARLKKALGDPFRGDKRLAQLRAIYEAAQRVKPPRATRPPRADFLARADAFLAAQEIAVPIERRRDKGDAWADGTSRAAALHDVEAIATGRVRTLQALRDLEQAFLTAWNEGPPRETRPFWVAVARAGLPYVRRDLMGEILARGRITSREHYEFALDMIGIAEEEHGLSAAQVARLARMIGSFESRR